MGEKQLGHFLKRHRQTWSFGIREAARRAKVSKGVLSKIEHGQDMRVSTLRKILRVYGLKFQIVYA